MGHGRANRRGWSRRRAASLFDGRRDLRWAWLGVLSGSHRLLLLVFLGPLLSLYAADFFTGSQATQGPGDCGRSHPPRSPGRDRRDDLRPGPRRGPSEGGRGGPQGRGRAAGGGRGQRDKAVAAERQAGVERDKAVAAERQTGIERDKAVAAEAKSRAINDFLTQDLLTQAEPANNAVEDHVTLLEVVDRAAEKVGRRFAGQPELEAAVRVTIGRTYHGLASWEKAEAQSRWLLDEARKIYDPQSAESYIAQAELAHILGHRGRRDPEVMKMAEMAAEGLERTVGPDQRTLVASLHLALAYQDAGRLPEAIALFERVRDAEIARLGPDHPGTLTTLDNLAGAYRTAGRTAEAIALFERVRDARIARLGPDHPETLTTLDHLAATYWDAGKTAEAIALFERIRDAQIVRLGPDHPSTLTTLNNLAAAYQDAGKTAEAIALFERVRDALIAKLGPDHPDTLITLNNLAAAYWTAKRLDRSVPLFEDVLRRQEAMLGRQHPETQLTVANLGVELQGLRPARRGDPAPRRGPPRHRQVPAPSLDWQSTPRCLRQGGPAGRGREAGPGGRGRRPRYRAEGQPAIREYARPLRPEAAPSQGLCRGRADPPRMPGHPREDSAGPVDHLQRQVDARRRPAGPEEVRRGRAAAGLGLRGDEAARGDDPAVVS